MDTATPPVLPDHQAVAGTRKYRSKAQRPCDLCRARKVLCNIPDPSRPCQLCRRIGRDCTFVGNPGKRPSAKASSGRVESPPSTAPDRNIESHSVFTTSVMDMSSPEVPVQQQQQQLDQSGSRDPVLDMIDRNDTQDPSPQNLGLHVNDFIWPNQDAAMWDLSNDGFTQRSLCNNDDSPSSFHIDFLSNLGSVGGPAQPGAQPQDQTFGYPVKSLPPSSPSARRAHEPLSLENRPAYSTTFIGYSNESDPFALNHFPHNEQDEIDFFRVAYRKVSSEGSSESQRPSNPLHFLMSQPATAAESQRVVDGCLPRIDSREHLESLVSRNNGVALVKLFFRFVFPSLPILSRSLVLGNAEAFVASAPTGLLAGIYALASKFAPWDDALCLHNAYSEPSIEALWQICYTCLQRELQFPRLSTVQIFLLLLNHVPFDSVSVENPFAWSMAASMLAMAQSLGLPSDPIDWNLPAWEIRLRRRLWWAVVVEHTWRSITHGRSSMLRDDDWDVSPLTADDFIIEPQARLPNQGYNLSPEYFIQLSSLTLVADQICRQFYTLRAVSKRQSLEMLIPQARELRQRLLDWLEQLPESLQLNFEKTEISEADSVESHAPLYLAYYTAHILIFRALLRPIIGKDVEPGDLQPTVVSVLQASRSLIQTVMRFICGFDARHQSAFWPAYTRHCLSYPGLFCYMLSLQQSEPHMAAFDQNLLDTWRKTLRTRVQSWPLLRFAIVKIDAVYWKGIPSARSC